MATIKEASLDDLEEILLMLHEASNELPEYNVLGFSMAKTARSIGGLIIGDHGIVNLVEVKGETVGIIVGVVLDYWFNDDTYATDLVLYVKKEYRTSNYGYRLIKSFINWAASKDVEEITTGISSGVDIDKAGRLFERMGFKNKGKMYSRKRKK